MRILPIQAFHNVLQAPKPLGRYTLGALDVGRKHIGVAYSPLLSSTVSPLVTVDTGPAYSLENNNVHKGQIDIFKLSRKLQMHINKQNMVGLVIGFPLDNNGQLTSFCEDIVDIASTLNCYIPYDSSQEMICTFWDERSSSVGARRLAKGMSSKLSTARKYKDTFAACLILRGFLDHVSVVH
jgi:RNase H-fold protein (predicted Holliday junction resolvase)